MPPTVKIETLLFLWFCGVCVRVCVCVCVCTFRVGVANQTKRAVKLKSEDEQMKTRASCTQACDLVVRATTMSFDDHLWRSPVEVRFVCSDVRCVPPSWESALLLCVSVHRPMCAKQSVIQCRRGSPVLLAA